MKYSITCPPPCNHTIRVDARNDDEAIKKIMEEGKEHVKRSHPDEASMSDAELSKMVRANMKKAA